MHLSPSMKDFGLCDNELIDLSGRGSMIVTPFQIFCHQNREITSRMNPHLKGTAVTSLLAKAWKGLDQSRKKHFEELSYSLRKNIPISDGFSYTEPIIQVVQPCYLPYLPKIQIIERNGHGKHAAEASNMALRSNSIG